VSIDVKTGSPDPADFAMTRLQIQTHPLVYRAVTAAICQWSHNDCETSNTPHLIFCANCHNIAFFGDNLRQSFGSLQKTVADLPQWKTTLNFYDDTGWYIAEIYV
jgi:hypothetical protein